MYLWVNLADLDVLGSVGCLGSPLVFMICEDRGDRLLPGAYAQRERLDEVYVLVECTPERCDAIKGGMELVSSRKIGRRIRMRETENLPRDNWKYISEKGGK